MARKLSASCSESLFGRSDVAILAAFFFDEAYRMTFAVCTTVFVVKGRQKARRDITGYNEQFGQDRHSAKSDESKFLPQVYLKLFISVFT